MPTTQLTAVHTSRQPTTARISARRLPVWWLAVLVLLLAAALGIAGLDRDAIWYDEYWSLDYSGGTHEGTLRPAETWARVAASEHELNPPGYYLALNVWASLVGWSTPAVRSLSLLFGLLGIAWTYRLGRDVHSPLAGVLAAAAIGASAFYVYYLHEARAYALFPLFGSMTLWAYWRMQTGHAGRRTDVFLFIGVLGLLYTHYLAGLLAIVLALYHLLFGPKNRGWWRVVVLMGAAGLIFLPWFAESLAAFDNVGSTTGRDSFSMPFDEAVRLLAFGFGNGLWPLVLVVLFGAAMSRGRAVGLVWFLTGAVLVVAFVGEQFLPFLGHIRYLMALMPLWALLFAFSVDWYRRRASRSLALLLVGVWLVSGAVSALGQRFDDVLFRDIYLPIFRPHLPLHEMADVIAENVQDGDVVAYYAPEYPWSIAGSFNYYMYPLGVQSAMLDQFSAGETEDATYPQMTEFLNDSVRVWFAREPGNGSARLLAFERALADLDFRACPRDWQFNGLSLQLYSTIEGCCCPPDDMADVVATFDNGVTLTYADPLPRVSDHTVQTVFAWLQGDAVPREIYSVALHVLDADGELVAQTDYGLPDHEFQCVRAPIDVSALPPGQYTLALIMYAWQTGERVAGTLADTGERGEVLPFARFDVE